jgi:hypothetical protein
MARIQKVFTIGSFLCMAAGALGQAVPVPFVTAVAGIGTAALTCTTSIVSTDGSNLGDGCPATQAKLMSPQGATVDKYGNVYVADYNDRQVRVVYNGNPQLAAAIQLANSGYAISTSHSAPAPTPIVGDIYTLAGVGASTTTFASLTGNACANYASSGATGINSLGDGCPGASAPIGPRDVKVDSDGNLFLADYTNGRIRVFCVNCATTTLAAKLITLENPAVKTPSNGAMYTIAGFANGYRDGYPAYNSAANVTGATAAASIALLREPTEVALSPGDDVFIADDANDALRVLYNGGSAASAILKAQGITPVSGYVYTIAGAGCVSAPTNSTGSVATTNACLSTTDTDTAVLGNANGSTIVWAVYLDPDGNVFYTDATNARIKVIYGGGVAPLSFPNSAYPTLKTGYTYTFAGQGTATSGSQTGVAPGTLNQVSSQSISGDIYGNLFFFDYSLGYLYEASAQTGLVSVIGGNSKAVSASAGTYCNGSTTGPKMTDSYYDGCPATQAAFNSPRGPVVPDQKGNLFFGDSIGYFVREFSYNPTFPPASVNAAGSTQPYAFTFLSATSPTSIAVEASGATGSDFADAGGDTCSSGLTITVGVPGTTCVVYVSFTPSAVGARSGSVVLNSGASVLGEAFFTGVGNGSALALDPSTQTSVGTAYQPNGIALDGQGRVLISDLTTKSVICFTGGTPSTVISGLSAPTGVTVDNAGNIFVSDSTANNLTEVPSLGSKIVITSTLSNPHQIATDSLGRVYVADTGNNRIVVFGAGSTKTLGVVPFSNLSSPMGVAVDANFNVYASDKVGIYKLTPLGIQTTISSASSIAGIAVDAAGNVVSISGTTLAETTASGTEATLISSLKVGNAVFLDALGNAFVADSGFGGYVEFQRTAGFYQFPGTTGTTNLTLTSIGNQTIPSTAFTQTDTTDYTVVPASSNGCSGTLAAGSLCNLSASFSAGFPGLLLDTLNFTAPEANGFPVFSLINVSLVPAVALQASPLTLTYGNKETLTATAYGPGNTNGTITFSSGGQVLGSVPVNANGVAVYSYTPAVGTYSATASYTPTGSSTPTAVSTQVVTYVVSPATPTLAITVTPLAGYATTTFTLTASVSSSVGAPGGSVSFYVGTSTTALGAAPINGGTAMLNTVLPAGTDCIVASYSGDPSFASLLPAQGSCVSVTVAPGFGIVPSTNTLSFTSIYQQAQAVLTVNPGGRTDTLSFSCAGLPSKLACSFSPSTVVLAGGSTAVQVQMLVANSAATSGELRIGPGIGTLGSRVVVLAFLPLGIVLLLPKKRRANLPKLMFIVALMVGLLPNISGCSGQDPTTLNLKSGTYTFTVPVTSGATTLTTLTFTLNVP